MRFRPRWRGWLTETIILAVQLWIMFACTSAMNTTESMVARVVFAAIALLVLFKCIVPSITRFFNRRELNRR